MPVTLLPSIRTDEALVRTYLQHFFVSADSPREFEPYINDVYLRQLFAETKIGQGLGEPEQWASQLPPESFRQYKERVDIDFAFTNKTNFGADEPVRLDLHIKNVSSLLVKVFELNTRNFYREHQREADTDINLDGLVANSEQSIAFADSPLRRIDRQFAFPQLTKPGVYVVDFIGNGKSSRALVRKGKLRPLVVTSTAGQLIHVVDDANRLVKHASVWLGGQEYKADAQGAIVVPFSTNPGRVPMVLSSGDFSCLDYLDHQAEAYHLAAGIHVDREALLSQRVARLLVRPGIYLNDKPVSLKLLDEVKLRITSTDHDGIATSTEIPDFKLYEDRESVHEFRVPPRLAKLTIQLEAKVKSLSLSKTIDVATAETFQLNRIDVSNDIEDVHFAKFGADYVLELLGRTGEFEPDRTVAVALKHRDFRETVHVVLKSDARGRVFLGPVPEIANVHVTGPNGIQHEWTLPADAHTYRQLLDAKAGETITVPYLGQATEPTRDELALFEMRDDVIRADRFDALGVRNGLLEIRGLAGGDYELWLKQNGEKIRIRVVDGPIVEGYILGRLRNLQAPALKPVQIEVIETKDDFVTVRLSDVSPFARVHVFAMRYRPDYSAFADLGKIRDAALTGFYPAHAESTYLTGRNIGDEYRHVLDRKGLPKFPGNMAERPALLLNPWVVRSTETGEQVAAGGDSFGRMGEPPASQPASSPANFFVAATIEPLGGNNFANLDFLAEASAVLVNLVPDKDGVIKIRRADLGAHSMIQVVAVDPLSTTVRTITLPEQPAKFLDLRLLSGLDPKGHFTQQKQVSILTDGKPFVLADAAASRFESYDSLARVYALYATLSKDPKLAEFAFLLNWPKLKDEEKRAKYSKYACHEFHLFLAKKDPAFFKEVVRPYLTNKKDKTFLDRWLLEDNLTEFLTPWNYEQLNTVERVLLAQRIAGEPAHTVRYLNDIVRLQPPGSDRMRMLFETAVKASELDAKGANKYGLPILSSIRAVNNSNAGGSLNSPAPAGLPEKPADAASRLGAGAGMGRGRRAGGAMGGAPGAMGRPEDERLDGKSEKAKGDFDSLDQKGAEKAPVEFFGLERKKVANRPLYRGLEPTQEWAEDNYYHLPIEQQIAGLVGASSFWLDYARYDGKGTFLSTHFADASHNFTEMMFALAVLDLPFEAGKHTIVYEKGGMTFTPAGPVIAFHEEVRPVAAPANKSPVLISQNFYRLGDRFRQENGEKTDKFVTGEFVIEAVYGCEVVVTNSSSAKQKLAVLVQLPTGSIPIGNAKFTRTVQLELEPYRTQTIDVLFYFPDPGHFVDYPVHVARDEKLLAAAEPASFDVVAKPTKPDTESWDYVSQEGTLEQLLALLNRENIQTLDLEKIAFRMRDQVTFESVIRLLRERHIYQNTLWSYGLFHNAPAVAREYLLHAESIVASCAGPIRSPLLTIDPVARHQYQHLEYKPLVNARTHALGKRRQIVNAKELEQYHKFLKLLTYQNQLDQDELLATTYYLLLQDRIEPALATFERVDPAKVATKLQYDYCAAYLDMYSDEPARAPEIAARYAKYPVDRWRNAFGVIGQQIEEARGKVTPIADSDDRSQQQGHLAATEAAFDFTLEAQKINLNWQNVEAVQVNYYLMDVELLFSRNPFIQQFGSQFASIRPNATKEIKLPAGQNRLAVPLPENLIHQNVLVEVSAAGKSRMLPYYANAMDVRMMENYGQLRVTNAANGKPVAKVYVKVYARLGNGQVKFYKDGYTDHRGRFDYASVSTPEQQPVGRFAILALSDEQGALIREVAPPLK
jgi:hypothetical protein